jgi:thymidine phosphorylase
MRDATRARELAETLVRVGTDAGKRVSAILTDMSAPLGKAVGNANETREAIRVLHGEGPPDLVECTMALGAEMLLVAGASESTEAARAELGSALGSGKALGVFERMVAAQGGDARVAQDPGRLLVAPGVPVLATGSGYVAAIDALEIGLVGVALGAGRTRADQKVDPAVGLSIEKKPGAHVARGEPLAFLHVRQEGDAEAVRDRVLRAFRLSEEAPREAPLVLGRIECGRPRA